MESGTFDVVIVGAGIAGLAAARRAMEIGMSALVLEASDRIGGRIHSIALANDRWWESGASTLDQPPVNLLLAECERLGIPFTRIWSPPGTLWQDQEPLHRSVADEIRNQVDEADSLLRELSDSGEDAAYADLLDPASEIRDLAIAYLTGQLLADPKGISALDRFAHGSFEGSWPVDIPLSAVLEQLFADIPVRLNSPVHVVDYGGDDVRIDVLGDLITASTAIVSVSTGVLMSGDVTFVPELDSAHTDAIGNLPMNRVISAVIVPSEPIADSTTASHQFLDQDLGYMTITLRSGSSQQINCLLTAPDDEPAETLEDAIVESAALATGITEFDRVELVDWSADPFIRGGWSIAQPSAISQRAQLAEPLADRVWFAGEATSRIASGTLHGAMQSGIDAANNIAIQLGLLPPDRGIGDTDPIFKFPY